MHSSRMRTARFSGHLPCKHTPSLPCMSPCPLPHMPPLHHTCPLHPPFATHATFHQACPSCQADPPATQSPPVNRITDKCKNITPHMLPICYTCPLSPSMPPLPSRPPSPHSPPPWTESQTGVKTLHHTCPPPPLLSRNFVCRR